jgi:hypothetical protein
MFLATLQNAIPNNAPPTGIVALKKIESLQWVLLVIFAIKNDRMVVI